MAITKLDNLGAHPGLEYFQQSGLHILESGPSNPEVDIVAVHGLAANPVYTWIRKVQDSNIQDERDRVGRLNEKGFREVMWLKHFLPAEVPNARILKYNYASTYLVNAPRETLRSIAERLVNLLHELRIKEQDGTKRPLIFIGHSFGGLVIEEALVYAYKNQAFKYISLTTCGVIFLGTPHRGSRASSWGVILANTAAALGLGSDNRLLKTLKENSEMLEHLLVDFTVMARENDMKLICFYETLPTRFGIFARTLVVDKRSATIDGYQPRSLVSNHSDMNKFGSRTEENFIQVSSAITELAKWSYKSPIIAESQMKDLRDCRIWLAALESDLEYEKNREARTLGTCEWILEHKDFKAWMGFCEPVLVIYGIPGAGKSVLLAFIIEYLREQSPQSSKTPILYFFFKNGNLKTESPVTMLATLIDQLVEQYKSPQAIDLLKKSKYESNSRHCRDFNQLWHLFISLLHLYDLSQGPISILIDALDECGDREKCSQFLEYVARTKIDWKAFGVRFVLTSRPQINIMEAVKLDDIDTNASNSSGCLEVVLAGELVKQDIIRYVEEKTATKRYRKLQQFRAKLIEVLPEKSQGMFRYAVLMLDELLKPNPEDVDNVLSSIPAGLGGIYIWILEHLGEDPGELLLRKTVFTWIALAFRPIYVEEIALAYASCDHSNESDSEFDPSKKALINEQDIHRSCGPLVEITQHGTLVFTHFSVKEFLLDKPEERTVARSRDASHNTRSHLVTDCLIHDLGVAHAQILKSCMRQILSSAFLEGPPQLQRNLDEIYSATHWIHHAALSDVQNLGLHQTERSQQAFDPWPAVCQFFLNIETSFSKWVQQFPVYEWSVRGTCLFYRQPVFPGGGERRLSPLHVMACFGLRIPLSHVVEVADLGNLDTGDDSQKSPLSWAADKGNFGIAKTLLGIGADMETKDIAGRTPLSWAARHGHTEIIRLFLEKNADTEAEDVNGRTPLSWATIYGHTEAVKLLLESNADTEVTDVNDRTLLSWAAENGHIEAAQLLLQRNTDPDAKDINGRTPLSWAAEDGTTEIVKLLLEQTIDVESRDIAGQTPISWATAKGHVQVTKLLLEKNVDMEAKDLAGQTPLSRAVEKGHAKVAKLLLENGANPDTKDVNGRTPLFRASEKGHVEVVKLLLENNADMEAKDINGRTSLSWAANAHRWCELEAAKLLVENGADLETRDINDRTPLSWAVTATGGDVFKVVELLLENGAETETQDINARTPLSWAAQKGNVEIVELLLEKSLDTESKDIAGQTPLSWAAGKGHFEVVKLLLENNANLEAMDVNGRTPLSRAAEEGHAEIVKLLLQLKADQEAKDINGRTSLSWAVNSHKWGELQVAKLLIENSADVETKDTNGRTPLSWAVTAIGWDVVKVAELLLESGADVNAEDINGRTPLSWAAEKGRVEVMKVLLENNADKGAKDVAGRTALSWAVENGHNEVMELLFKKGNYIEAKIFDDQTRLSSATEDGGTVVKRIHKNHERRRGGRRWLKLLL